MNPQAFIHYIRGAVGDKLPICNILIKENVIRVFTDKKNFTCTLVIDKDIEDQLDKFINEELLKDAISK